MEEAVAALLALVTLLLFGCVISPRRVVENPPFPSPTPTGATATPTPSPTLTPTPMSTVEPFLFTANPGSRTITGNRVQPDGTLVPLPGPPIITDESPREITAMHDALVVAGERTLRAFLIDKNSGAIRQTDSAHLPMASSLSADPSSMTVRVTSPSGVFSFTVEQGRLIARPADGNTGSNGEREKNRSALDPTGKFFFVLDPSAAQISIYRVNGDQLTMLASHPVSGGTTSIALAVP